jgi:hypothetical protein
MLLLTMPSQQDSRHPQSAFEDSGDKRRKSNAAFEHSADESNRLHPAIKASATFAELSSGPSDDLPSGLRGGEEAQGLLPRGQQHHHNRTYAQPNNM